MTGPSESEDADAGERGAEGPSDDAASWKSARAKLRALRKDLEAGPARPKPTGGHPSVPPAPPTQPAAEVVYLDPGTPPVLRAEPMAPTRIHRRAVLASRVLAFVLLVAGGYALFSAESLDTYNEFGASDVSGLGNFVGTLCMASSLAAFVGAVGLASSRRWGWYLAVSAAIGSAAAGAILLQAIRFWPLGAPLLVMALVVGTMISSREVLRDVVFGSNPAR